MANSGLGMLGVRIRGGVCYFNSCLSVELRNLKWIWKWNLEPTTMHLMQIFIKCYQSKISKTMTNTPITPSK